MTIDHLVNPIIYGALSEEKERLEKEKDAHQTEADCAYEAKHRDKQAAIDTWAAKDESMEQDPAARTVLMS